MTDKLPCFCDIDDCDDSIPIQNPVFTMCVDYDIEKKNIKNVHIDESLYDLPYDEQKKFLVGMFGNFDFLDFDKDLPI